MRRLSRFSPPFVDGHGRKAARARLVVCELERATGARPPSAAGRPRGPADGQPDRRPADPDIVRGRDREGAGARVRACRGTGALPVRARRGARPRRRRAGGERGDGVASGLAAAPAREVHPARATNVTSPHTSHGTQRVTPAAILPFIPGSTKSSSRARRTNGLKKRFW